MINEIRSKSLVCDLNFHGKGLFHLYKLSKLDFLLILNILHELYMTLTSLIISLLNFDTFLLFSLLHIFWIRHPHVPFIQGWKPISSTFSNKIK